MLVATDSMLKQWLPWFWLLSHIALYQWILILMKHIVFKQYHVYCQRNVSEQFD